MKNAFLIAVLTLLGSFSIAWADSQIQWRNAEVGLEEGKRDHKYVLADVYTEWCGWCKKLDRDTFTNRELINFLSGKFICVKANAEDHSGGQKLASEYGVNGYPCALVFDQNGKLIGRIVGYKDASGYESALRDIINNHR